MAKYPQLTTNFLQFVKVNTRSNPDSTTSPSDEKEVQFIAKLKDYLLQLPLTDVKISEASGYVLATLPSNVDVKLPTVGFIAHVDTADFNSENVNPRIVENYDGHKVINLDPSGKYQLDPAVFPNLKNYAGQDLIVTDGTTLLGADDKAGVAEILAAVEYLIAHPEIKHGDVRIGFGPDEEIGQGATHFDVAEFAADWAYTVDGGPLGELNYETFNAAEAKITIQGANVHPGSAKDGMVSALQIGIDLHNQLPKDQRAETTSGREGFYHLYDLTGTVDQAQLTYIIRDHDKAEFTAKKQRLTEIVAALNRVYGDRIQLELTDQYYNMGEIIKQHPEALEVAKQGIINAGITPDIFAVRGGTDGSIISYMGLPTPNLFAGGENMHGRYEYISIQTMEKATDVIVEIIKLINSK